MIALAEFGGKGDRISRDGLGEGVTRLRALPSPKRLRAGTEMG
jgi:hypothetical protein